MRIIYVRCLCRDSQKNSGITLVIFLKIQFTIYRVKIFQDIWHIEKKYVTAEDYGILYKRIFKQKEKYRGLALPEMEHLLKKGEPMGYIYIN